MKKVFLVLALGALMFSCGEKEGEGTMSICECDNLFEIYSKKKEEASSEKERQELAKEELSKNAECLKIESKLGDKLEEERAKCK